jgi:ABC-type uncharacterized transport system involved in gliding motility auxiliary subunit
VRRNQSLLGLLGLVFLLFAVLAGAFTGGRTAIDVVYIAANGIVGLFCLIAYLSAGLEQLRNAVTERSTRYGANVVVGSLAFLGVLVVLNYLGARHSKRFDLTEQKVYSLSDQSINVVKNLENELKMLAFVEGGINPELRDLLSNYARHSSKVSFELIDPDKQPELAEKYQIRTYNTVRVEYGNESTLVTQPNEENITNAIIKVTRKTRKVVCVIEGHGEPDLDDLQNAKGLASFRNALTNENYEVKKVLLASEPKVPDDCSVVVVAGPQRPFLDHELQALETYLENGGRLLAMIPPRTGDQFTTFLAKWGVKLGNDVVVDQVVRLFQGPALGLTPLANTYGFHEITRDFKQRTIFPLTRSVKSDAAGKSGITAVELVKTSPSSWAETDLEGVFQRGEASLDANADLKGPVPVAVAVDANLKQMGRDKDGNARLVVFGSIEFASNRELDGTFYNRDLLMNALGWLVGESDLVSIRPRGLRASRIQFTPEQSLMTFYITVLLIPQLLLIVGIVVWWRRE